MDTHSPETLIIGDADVGFKKWSVYWLIPQCELPQQSQHHGVHPWTAGQLGPSHTGSLSNFLKQLWADHSSFRGLGL